MSKDKNQRRKWTYREVYLLKNHYCDTPMEELQRIIPNRSRAGIIQKANHIGLKKSEEFKRKNWDEFVKKSANNVFNKPQQSKPNPGQFKKGHKPSQTKDNGVERIWKNAGREYWFRKIDGKWYKIHILNWEEKHGPIPKGYFLVSKDKENTLNTDPSNWEMVNRKENALRNIDHKKAHEQLRRKKLLREYGYSG